MNALATREALLLDSVGAMRQRSVEHALRERESRQFLQRLRSSISFAFQPIVSIHSGLTYGFEALLRGHERMGAPSIASLLDDAYGHDHAAEADTILRRIAISEFARLGQASASRLFFNLDNRLLDAPGFRPEQTFDLLHEHGLAPSMFCIEVSERHAVLDVKRAQDLLSVRAQASLIALDDFGTGYSGLRLLCESSPDLVKIDRFFIAGIDSDQTKRVFLSSIVALAHAKGTTVVAEGVETEPEFRICRDIGCDLVQGYFIARPSIDPSAALVRYPVVLQTNHANQRARLDGSGVIRAELDRTPALDVETPMAQVLDAFRAQRSRSFLPLVDSRAQPVGIIHESSFKDLLYSPFGKDLLSNSSRPFTTLNFVSRCLIADVNTPLDDLLAGAASLQSDLSTIITEDGAYLGVLDPAAIIRLLHERTLRTARNEHPLTRLHGNIAIEDYLRSAFDRPESVALVHLDLNRFKAFNDRFGFRLGDRAILMFADLLRARFRGSDAFLGHIGGDDFFVGLANVTAEVAEHAILGQLQAFARDASCFYLASERDAGLVDALDRDGVMRRIPLLSASAGMLFLPPGPRCSTIEEADAILANLKTAAKANPGGLAVHRLRSADSTAQVPAGKHALADAG